jgi:hypothetical protein
MLENISKLFFIGTLLLVSIGLYSISSSKSNLSIPEPIIKGEVLKIKEKVLLPKKTTKLEVVKVIKNPNTDNKNYFIYLPIEGSDSTIYTEITEDNEIISIKKEDLIKYLLLKEEKIPDFLDVVGEYITPQEVVSNLEISLNDNLEIKLKVLVIAKIQPPTIRKKEKEKKSRIPKLMKPKAFTTFNVSIDPTQSDLNPTASVAVKVLYRDLSFDTGYTVSKNVRELQDTYVTYSPEEEVEYKLGDISIRNSLSEIKEIKGVSFKMGKEVFSEMEFISGLTYKLLIESDSKIEYYLNDDFLYSEDLIKGEHFLDFSEYYTFADKSIIKVKIIKQQDLSKTEIEIDLNKKDNILENDFLYASLGEVEGEGVGYFKYRKNKIRADFLITKDYQSVGIKEGNVNVLISQDKDHGAGIKAAISKSGIIEGTKSIYSLSGSVKENYSAIDGLSKDEQNITATIISPIKKGLTTYIKATYDIKKQEVRPSFKVRWNPKRDMLVSLGVDLKENPSFNLGMRWKYNLGDGYLGQQLLGLKNDLLSTTTRISKSDQSITTVLSRNKETGETEKSISFDSKYKYKSLNIVTHLSRSNKETERNKISFTTKAIISEEGIDFAGGMGSIYAKELVLRTNSYSKIKTRVGSRVCYLTKEKECVFKVNRFKKIIIDASGLPSTEVLAKKYENNSITVDIKSGETKIININTEINYLFKGQIMGAKNEVIYINKEEVLTDEMGMFYIELKSGSHTMKRKDNKKGIVFEIKANKNKAFELPIKIFDNK